MLLPKFICFSTVWRDPFTSRKLVLLLTLLSVAHIFYFSFGFSSMQSLYCIIVPCSCSGVYHLDLDDIIPPKVLYNYNTMYTIDSIRVNSATTDEHCTSTSSCLL